MIDLRSDVAAATAEMRRAMAEAPGGDELFGECPTTCELEAYAARLLGKEAALFVPTGTMGNAIAVALAHCRGDHTLMDAESHINRRELRGALAGLSPSLYDTPDGCPDEGECKEWCRRVTNRALICLETAHTCRRRRAVPLDRLRGVAQIAREAGARVHLDGARLFNAAVALGVAPAAVAEVADTVVISLCKSIGAPAGAILVGERWMIDAARNQRLALGGTMRQTGALAAAGLVALRTGTAHLATDHARAGRLACVLAEFDPLGVRPEDFDTNAVTFDPSPLGLSEEQFAARLAEAGVKVALLAPNVVRLMTHRGLSDADVESAAAALRRALGR